MNNNTGNYEHIMLPKYEEEFKKKKKQGFSPKIKRRENKNRYMETQIFNLAREQDSLNETKRKFSKYSKNLFFISSLFIIEFFPFSSI